MSGHDDRLVRRIAEAAAGRDPDGLCPDTEALGLYAERDLEGDELGRVEAHVAGCARCQATVAAFIRSAPELADVAGAAGSVGAGVQRWWAGWRWLVPATATAAVVMLAVWVGRGPSEQAAESTRAADSVVAEQAVVPPAAVGGASNMAVPQTAPEELQKQLSARSAPVGRDNVPAAPAAVGPLADGRAKAAPPAAFSAATPAPAPALAPAGAAPEARFERAQPERQREAEARRDAAEQGRAQMQAAAAPPPPAAVAAPAAPPPPAPAAVQPPQPSPPVPLQEAITANPNAAAVSAARGARGAERNAAGSEAMAKPTASDAVAKSVGARVVELTGRVTYRTRQALPAGATIEVRLLDVSRMDVRAEELGRAQIVTKGEQVPVPFVIRYDASAIEAARRYTVQATITVAGRVAFRTTSAPTVLTNGGSGTNVEVVVEPSR